MGVPVAGLAVALAAEEGLVVEVLVVDSLLWPDSAAGISQKLIF